MIRLENQEMYRIPNQADLVKEDCELCLNAEQNVAVKQIFREWKEQEPRPVLLFGVTGSGKTQVYMRLIQQVIQEGKTGYCPDPGGCPHLSDCAAILCHVRR